MGNLKGKVIKTIKLLLVKKLLVFDLKLETFFEEKESYRYREFEIESH